MYAHTSPSYVVGVDVGGTKIATLLVDQRRQVCGHLTVATDLTSPQHTLTCIIDAIRATLRQGNVEPERLRAIGLGIPGQVVPTTGVVKLAVNLGWDAMPVGALINAAFGVPCVLENDVRAAAWGLYRMGHVDDAQSLAYVSIGTGIAAGLVLDGRVYRGWSGMAGEIGHSCVDPSGPRCACGQHGCLEAMAAGPAIAALAAE
ncbi:MAG TPA: ROK family protein, partial [Herpetosiphonaceae bacterium]